MELLLNLTWLSVAILCAISLLKRALRERDTANIWLFATAMLCVVVLLFPVISMTDDLHAEVFTAEENGKRRIAAIQIQQQVANLNALVTRLVTPVFTQSRYTWSSSVEIFVPRPLPGCHLSSFTRPPPSIALA